MTDPSTELRILEIASLRKEAEGALGKACAAELEAREAAIAHHKKYQAVRDRGEIPNYPYGTEEIDSRAKNRKQDAADDAWAKAKDAYSELVLRNSGWRPSKIAEACAEPAKHGGYVWLLRRMWTFKHMSDEVVLMLSRIREVHGAVLEGGRPEDTEMLEHLLATLNYIVDHPKW
jgi:hypothetical protein